MSALKEQRVAAAEFYDAKGAAQPGEAPVEGVDKQALIDDVAQALYASKVIAYA